MKRRFKAGSILLFLMMLIAACNNYTPEQEAYIKQIKKEREDKDNRMQYDESSPFDAKGKSEFHGLNYFDVNPNFVFKSKLIEYELKDTVTIFGTKGEERVAVRFGFLPFSYENVNHKLNVYQNFARGGQIYYSTWFTDKTTAEETYGVGRYLHFEYNSNPNFEYTLDFNNAYNPYCAYSANYSCAIPSKKDFVNLEITAGEKSYHD